MTHLLCEVFECVKYYHGIIIAVSVVPGMPAIIIQVLYTIRRESTREERAENFSRKKNARHEP